jgi:signal transduction histidine kinase
VIDVSDPASARSSSAPPSTPPPDQRPRRNATRLATRFADGLPSWFGSIKMRLAFVYSVVVFGLAAILVAGIYLGLSRSLARQPVTDRLGVPVAGEPSCYWIRGTNIRTCEQSISPTEIEVPNQLKAFEKEVNQRALVQFRRYSFGALGALFLLSLGVGWVLADRTLRPIGRITRVAQDISETDLSRRINLAGPPDELKNLADTFDDMLERLEGAFENQRQFIHEASHELRNPIAIIRTNVDVALADGTASPGELRETLSVVGRAAERIGVLVGDLLTYARRESPASREAVVDVAATIRETAAEFEAPAATRRLRLRAEVHEELLVSGDPVALKQALANLVGNAVRLAPEGTTITIAGGHDASWVWMAVNDEGPGIAAADQPRVFDRFWRGDPRRGQAEGHSGLGLTIVRQIARGHGGSVNVESTPGAGSTFSVWLPGLSVDPNARAGSAPGAPAERPAKGATAVSAATRSSSATPADGAGAPAGTPPQGVESAHPASGPPPVAMDRSGGPAAPPGATVET